MSSGIPRALRTIAVMQYSTRGKPERWGGACVPAAYWGARSRIASEARFAELRGLLRPHPLAECGERLEVYSRWNGPNRDKFPAPPEGAELRRAARAALGLDAGTGR